MEHELAARRPARSGHCDVGEAHRLAAFGILTTLPLFWSLPTAFLAGTAAAAGLAFTNSIGNLAGFISPFAVGWVKDLTQSTDNGMYLIASLILLGGFLVIAFVP